MQCVIINVDTIIMILMVISSKYFRELAIVYGETLGT